MIEPFDLDTAVWAGTDFTTASGSVVTTQTNYSDINSAIFALDETFGDPAMTDLVSPYNVIPYANIDRSVLHTAVGTDLTGYFFGFTTTDSYINIPAYQDSRSEFTFKCILQTNSATTQTILEASYGTDIRYKIYLAGGSLYFYFKDMFGDDYTIQGPAVSNDVVHAIGVSMNQDSVVFGVDGVTLDTTGAVSFYGVEDGANLFYVGGTPESVECFDGIIARPTLLNYGLPQGASSFSTWLVAPLYEDAYFDAALTTPSVITADTPVTAAIMVDGALASEHKFQVSLDNGASWGIPVNSVWAVAGVNYATLSEINASLALLDLSGSPVMLLRTLVATGGLIKKTISSLELIYTNASNPLSWKIPTSVTYGAPVRIVEHFYSTGVDYPIVHINSLTSNPVNAQAAPVDGTWVDPDTITGGGALSGEALIYIGDGVNTVNQTVSVAAHQVEIAETSFAGGVRSPSVSVFHTGVFPERILIEDYVTPSGATILSLMSGDYKFKIQAYDGEMYTQYHTITGDTTLRLQGTGAEASSRAVASNTLSMTIEDSVFASGDTPTMSFLIRDASTHLAKNLDEYTIYFSMRKVYEVGASITKTCTSLGGGKASVKLTTGDTADVGRYIAEVSLEKVGERLTVIPHFIIEIIPSIR